MKLLLKCIISTLLLVFSLCSDRVNKFKEDVKCSNKMFNGNITLKCKEQELIHVQSESVQYKNERCDILRVSDQNYLEVNCNRKRNCSEIVEVFCTQHCRPKSSTVNYECIKASSNESICKVQKFVKSGTFYLYSKRDKSITSPTSEPCFCVITGQALTAFILHSKSSRKSFYIDVGLRGNQTWPTYRNYIERINRAIVKNATHITVFFDPSKNLSNKIFIWLSITGRDTITVRCNTPPFTSKTSTTTTLPSSVSNKATTTLPSSVGSVEATSPFSTVNSIVSANLTQNGTAEKSTTSLTSTTSREQRTMLTVNNSTHNGTNANSAKMSNDFPITTVAVGAVVGALVIGCSIAAFVCLRRRYARKQDQLRECQYDNHSPKKSTNPEDITSNYYSEIELPNTVKQGQSAQGLYFEVENHEIITNLTDSESADAYAKINEGCVDVCSVAPPNSESCQTSFVVSGVMSPKSNVCQDSVVQAKDLVSSNSDSCEDYDHLALFKHTDKIRDETVNEKQGNIYGKLQLNDYDVATTWFGKGDNRQT